MIPATAAPMASMESKPLAGRAAATGAGRLVAGAAAAEGRAAATGAAPTAGARGGMLGAPRAGAPLGNIGLGLPPPEAAAGPPGGSVGNLIVGAAVGFGGRLIRTVSFFGCTLPVSYLGGTAPIGAPGIFGMLSAIRLCREAKVRPHRCQIVIRKKHQAGRFRLPTRLQSASLSNGRRRVRGARRSRPHRSTGAGVPRADARH